MNTWKASLKKCIPLLKVYYFFKYRGVKRSYCPFCHAMVPLVAGGLPTPRPHAKCPICESLERHRFLYYVYQKYLLENTNRLKIFHFAPEEGIWNLFTPPRNRTRVSSSLSEKIDYHCGDLNPQDYSFAKDCEKVDALHMPYPDQTFDAILANHLIEHVDEQAFLQEMNRILKKGGRLFLSTPVYEDQEETLEDPAIVTPQQRQQFYGHPQHLRKYGRDIRTRLSAVFEVETVDKSLIPEPGDPVNTNCFILTKR